MSNTRISGRTASSRAWHQASAVRWHNDSRLTALRWPSPTSMSWV